MTPALASAPDCRDLGAVGVTDGKNPGSLERCRTQRQVINA